jgi:ABC-2 type transport system ATP-binding protein
VRVNAGHVVVVLPDTSSHDLHIPFAVPACHSPIIVDARDTAGTHPREIIMTLREPAPPPPIPQHDLVIATKGLGKRFDDRIVAVEHLDLQVKRGEVYGFLGPNGAGKTTTLRMLLGLSKPTSGTAMVAGAAPGSPESLGRIGAMIETPAFYPFLSGRDNLRTLAMHAGAPIARIDEALDQVDLLKRGGDKFGTYSLGMKQRLGVAAALIKDPALLILDEPTNGLDPAGMAEMRTLIRQLGQGERTVLLSSHMMTEVEQVCDRVGVVRNGHLVAEGAVDELRGHSHETLRVRAHPLDAARNLLSTTAGVRGIEQDNDLLRVTTTQERIPELNRLLVEAGIAVFELHWQQASLEEVFFDLTREPEPEMEHIS